MPCKEEKNKRSAVKNLPAAVDRFFANAQNDKYKVGTHRPAKSRDL